MLFRRLYNKKTAAFSLLEVLITAAIVGIITAIVLVKYGSFNNAVLLKSQAYEIALDLRQAQTYGISIAGNSGEFREEYGVHFDLSPSTAGQYIFFQDNDISVPAGYESEEKIGDPVIIDSRFTLADICINNDSICAVNILDVTFLRPNFDAQLRAKKGSTVITANNATIKLTNVLDPSVTRNIIVTGTGQISVE